MNDEIFMNLKDLDLGSWPSQDTPAESDKNFVKHIHCEGAKFHVISYDTHGPRCSNPRCIINKTRKERAKESQIYAASFA
jgi:hypothetical protein